MYVAYGRNTMLGAQRIAQAKQAENFNARRQLQRELYETKLAEEQRIKDIRAAAEERRLAIMQEMKDRGCAYRHTFKEIERRACKLFKLTPKDLQSSRRNREVCFARQFVMYWTARLCGYSYPQIGRLLGKRDHTTILHGAKIYPEKRAYMGRNLRKPK